MGRVFIDMKYILKESQLEKAIYDYLDDLFPLNNLNWTHPPEESDEQGGWGDEDETRVEFYLGDYNDDETCFRWSSCDYFNPNSPAQNICPEVVVESPFDEQLNNYFGDLWHEPFKKWFTEKLNLPVKSIATW